MKTAISVPDDTFTRVEHRAQVLGITRSEFYTRAARRYLEQLDAESLTRQIDAALGMTGPDQSSQLAAVAGRRALRQLGEDDW